MLLKKLEVVRNKVKLVKFLGSGSFGEVWKGEDRLFEIFYLEVNFNFQFIMKFIYVFFCFFRN